MRQEIIEIEHAFKKLQRALNAESEEQWNIEMKDNCDIQEIQSSGYRFRIVVHGEITIHENLEIANTSEYLVAMFDNNNIRITIDGSGNHSRAHIHIGVRQDRYHSATIALDDGTLLNNTGNIAAWKIKKITDWVNDNRQILEKIYRCINPWGDVASAEKRKNKLSDFD